MSERTLTPLRLFVFAVGLFAAQTFWGFSMGTMPLYLMGLTNSESIVGLILSGAGIFGLFVPIAAGAISDRLVTPLGRRKPFIVGGWLMVTIILLTLPHVDSLIMAIPLTLLLYASFFCALGPYFALMSDITPPHLRGTASGVMFFVGGLGILTYFLIGARAWDTHPEMSFIVAAVSIVLSVTIMVIGTKEPERAPVTRTQKGLLFAVMREKRVLTFYAALFLWWSGTWMVNSLFVIAAQGLFDASVDEAILGLLISTLAYVVCAFPMGILGDRVGHKKVLMAGLLSYGLIFFSVPLIPDIRSAYFVMALAGMAFSILLSVGYAFLLLLIPKEQTAGFVGIYMACQNGSLLFGPALGGYFIENVGYPFLFFGAGSLIMIGFFILGTIKKEGVL
jgi:MFS family permease